MGVRPIAIYSLLAILLYFALRNAPLTEIWGDASKIATLANPCLAWFERHYLYSHHSALVVDRPRRKEGCFLFAFACNSRGCVWGQLLHTWSAGGWGAASSFVSATQLRHDLHPRHIHRGDG